MKSSIELRDLTKTFVRRSGEVVHAIDNVSVDIEHGEFLVLLGPSGCGKTTMLRSIAGLETPSQGSISVDETTIFDSSRGVNVPPEKRRMGMIFQSYALWPHMTVFGNVSYPLRMRGFPKSEIRERVQQTLDLVGIGNLAEQYPGQMSGGQQQRTALARALVGDSKVVLFDEPLSNVDAKVREQLRFEIRRMHDELGFTAVYVTHDQEEAMALGSRVAVMDSGNIEQLGKPTEIYRDPVSLKVGRFIGTLNEIQGDVASIDGDVCTVTTELGNIRAKAASGISEGDPVIVGVRPEDLSVIDADAVEKTTNAWTGVADVELFLGARSECMVRVNGLELRVSESGSNRLTEGATTGLTVDPKRVRVFPADTSADESMTESA